MRNVGELKKGGVEVEVGRMKFGNEKFKWRRVLNVSEKKKKIV